VTEETRILVFNRSGYLCEVCGSPIRGKNSPQIAHRIHKGKTAENHIMAYLWNTYGVDRNRRYVRENILENEKNLMAVCGGKCNDMCNIFFRPVERDALLDLIFQKKERRKKITTEGRK